MIIIGMPRQTTLYPHFHYEQDGKAKHVNTLPVMNAVYIHVHVYAVVYIHIHAVVYVCAYIYVHVHVLASVYMLLCDKDQLVNM